MRSILAIARVMSAMRSFTGRMVPEGSRLVMKLVPSPGAIRCHPCRPSLSRQPADEDLVPLRSVAGLLAMDRVPTPEEMAGLPETHLDWLRLLGRPSSAASSPPTTDLLRT